MLLSASMESAIKSATISERLVVLLGLLASAAGFVFLALVPDVPSWSHPVSRIGLVAAIFTCIWSALLCWTLCFVYLGRKRGWSLQPAVALFALAGFVWALSYLGTSAGFAGVLVTAQARLIPILARRLNRL
jgi:hypothetical protein